MRIQNSFCCSLNLHRCPSPSPPQAVQNKKNFVPRLLFSFTRLLEKLVTALLSELQQSPGFHFLNNQGQLFLSGFSVLFKVQFFFKGIFIQYNSNQMCTNGSNLYDKRRFIELPIFEKPRSTFHFDKISFPLRKSIIFVPFIAKPECLQMDHFVRRQTAIYPLHKGIHFLNNQG